MASESAASTPSSDATSELQPPQRGGMPGQAEEEVFRLHPLTPVALGGRILGVLAAVFLFSLVGHQAGQGGGPNVTILAIYGGLAVLVLVRGVIAVAVTRYHLLGGELRIDTGLLNKQSKRVRLNRVQSVDVLEPFSARIFSLAEVRVTTAGTERSAVRLRFLALPVAQKLRADLLSRSGGGEEGAPEAPERPVVTVPHGLLVRSVLLQMVSWRLVLLFIGPVLTVVGNQNGHQATAGLGIGLFIWFAYPHRPRHLATGEHVVGLHGHGFARWAAHPTRVAVHESPDRAPPAGSGHPHPSARRLASLRLGRGAHERGRVRRERQLEIDHAAAGDDAVLRRGARGLGDGRRRPRFDPPQPSAAAGGIPIATVVARRAHGLR